MKIKSNTHNMDYSTIDTNQNSSLRAKSMTPKELKRKSVMIASSQLEALFKQESNSIHCHGCRKDISADDAVFVLPGQAWHDLCYKLYQKYKIKTKENVELKASLRWMHLVFTLIDEFHQSVLDHQRVIESHFLNQDYKRAVQRSRTLIKQIEAMVLLQNSITSDSSYFDIEYTMKSRSKSLALVKDLTVEYVQICRNLDRKDVPGSKQRDISQKALILLEAMTKPIHTLLQQGMAWLFLQENVQQESIVNGHLHRIKALTWSVTTLSRSSGKRISRESRLPTPPAEEKKLVSATNDSTIKVKQTQHGTPYLSFSWNDSSDEDGESTSSIPPQRQRRPSAIRLDAHENSMYQPLNASRKNESPSGPILRQPEIINPKKSPLLKFLGFLDNSKESLSSKPQRATDEEKPPMNWRDDPLPTRQSSVLAESDSSLPETEYTQTVESQPPRMKTLKDIEHELVLVDKDIKLLERCQYFIRKGRYDLFHENIRAATPLPQTHRLP